MIKIPVSKRKFYGLIAALMVGLLLAFGMAFFAIPLPTPRVVAPHPPDYVGNTGLNFDYADIPTRDLEQNPLPPLPQATLEAIETSLSDLLAGTPRPETTPDLTAIPER